MTVTERAYYDQRAQEYDDWYLGTGLFAGRNRPGWHEEVERLASVVASIHARNVLDVACGTGFLTRYLQGNVTALDQSAGMLRVARYRLPGAQLLRGDALNLPFTAKAWDCLIAGHFYGHLRDPERTRFLQEARRVATRLVIIDAAWREGVEPEQSQGRILNDGSRHTVYKRYFTAGQLASELGDATILHEGRWFLAVSV